MRIYVINLRRVKKVVAFLLLIALSAAFTVGVLAAVDAYIYPAVSASAAEKITTVIIDAGHGGEDCGAIGANGVYEKDLNLAVANAMAEHFRERGYTVVMTRTDDRMLYSEEENVKGMRKLSDLKNRCKIASEHENAVLVSIHMNSFGAKQYSGLQVYYSEGNKASQGLADAVQKRVREDVQPDNNRVTKNGKGLYLLDNSDITSVIVECGFVSNEAECEKLSDKEYQNRLSLAIVCGIIEYIEAN